MSYLMRLGASVALLFFMLTGCSSPPVKPSPLARNDYSYTREYATWLINKEMARNNVTGLSIALVDDQQVVWAEGFGFADKAHNVKATPDTIYRVGSISKLFTATAVMQLVEQGKMDIDQPLTDYIPEFAIKSRFPATAVITPRRLMTHHSGLPSDLLKGMWTDKPEPFETVVSQVRDEYAAQPPGTVFSYSNLGVSLLGVALERASGRDYVSLMQDSVLRQLGMEHSSFKTGCDTSPLASKAYRNSAEVQEAPLRDIPAGGLNSTVNDLSRFISMILAKGTIGKQYFLKREALAEMLRPQNTDIPLDLNFRTGLGWVLSGLGDINIKNGGPVAHHSGATLYHRGMLVIMPEQRLGVVVLANSSSGSQVVSNVAAETLKLALEAKSGITQPERKAIAEGTASAEILDGYAGTYATIFGMVPVLKKAGYLEAEIMGASLRLVPQVDGLFGIRYRLLGLIPISLGDLDYVSIRKMKIAGQEVMVARDGEQELLIGKKIVPAPISSPWLERRGDYEIVNLGNDVAMFESTRLRYENGFLLVDMEIPAMFKGRVSFALQPVSDSEAVIQGFGRGMGETIQAVSVGGEEYLRYSGYLLKKRAQ